MIYIAAILLLIFIFLFRASLKNLFTKIFNFISPYCNFLYNFLSSTLTNFKNSIKKSTNYFFKKTDIQEHSKSLNHNSTSLSIEKTQDTAKPEKIIMPATESPKISPRITTDIFTEKKVLSIKTEQKCLKKTTSHFESSETIDNSRIKSSRFSEEEEETKSQSSSSNTFKTIHTIEEIEETTQTDKNREFHISIDPVRSKIGFDFDFGTKEKKTMTFTDTTTQTGGKLRKELLFTKIFEEKTMPAKKRFFSFFRKK